VQPVPPGNEGLRHGAVALRIQRDWPMVRSEPDDTLFVQFVNFLHYPKFPSLTFDRGMAESYWGVDR
jgi:hypothetical protein